MELLDGENKGMDSMGKTFGIIGGICYVIGGFSSLVSAYNSVIIYLALNHAGAPDAVRLGDGIQFALYGQIVSVVALLLGIICQRIAFSKYDFSPIWLWRVVLFGGACALFGGLFPLNLLIIIIACMSLVHVYTKKSFYFDVDNE